MATNVQTEFKGDKLVITVDVSKAILNNAEPSKTGKSKVVGSTHGFIDLKDGLKLGLNLIKK